MRLLAIFALAVFSRPASAMDTAAADAFFGRHAYAVSAEAYRFALRQARNDDEDAKARLGLADSLFRVGDAARARDAYEDFLERHAGGPREGRALLGLARASTELGDALGAEEAAARAEQALPVGDAWEAVLLDAEALYSLGRYPEAKRAYEQLGSKWPGKPSASYIPYAEAWCFYRWAHRGDAPGPAGPSKNAPAKPAEAGNSSTDALGDSLAALSASADLFAEVIRIDPDGPYASGATYQRAECLYSLGEWDEAAQAWKEFEERFPDDSLIPAARYSRAWCRFQLGQWKDAATAFHEFSVIHDEHPLAPWALYLAGVSLARGHDLDLAESAYRLCLQRYPESEVADRAQYGLAWLANMRKDHVAAAEAWAQFLKNWASSPLAPSATFLLADAEYQQGRYAAAHDRYLELLKRWPKHALAEDALYYAANATLALGEWDQARDEFRQFLRLRPGSIFAQDARLRLADCLFSLGDLESAEHAYVALRDDPSDPKEAARAELGLGWVSFARKDWDKAASRFKAAAAGLPPAEAGEAWLRAGDSLFNEGAHAAAQEAYLAAVGEGFPKSVRSQAESGAAWAAYRQKDFTRAYERWAAARDLAPDDTSAAEAAYWMGWALFRQGRYPEAAAAYAAVAAQHPKSHLVPDALVQEANSFQNGGACAQALPLYQKVVEAWPQHPKAGAALHGMQICYTALGREDDAVAAARAYLKQHADSEVAPEVQYQVAEHYLNHKDYGQAEKEFDRLKTEYPGSKVDATATYWRGEARFKESKFNAAIEDWKALVAHEPGHPLAPRALFRTGLAWYRQQEYAQAESTFLQVLDSYGNTPDVAADARFNLGMTYKRMNRNDDAVAAYKAVVKDYPSSELANMARIRIGYIYEDAKDYPKAIAAYRELAASDKGKLGAEAQYLVGDCLLAVKQTGEALLAYEAVGQNFPAESGWVVTADARAAEVLESLGRDKEALARYEEIVKTSPDSNWSAAARQRSALLRTRLGLPAAPAKPLAKPSAKSKAPKSKAAKAKVKGAAKAKPRMKTTPSAVEGGAQ